jgi:hypothetical protein
LAGVDVIDAKGGNVLNVADRIEVPERLVECVTNPDERRQLIASQAYLRAKARGFVPGHELEDWLAAEQDVNAACGLLEPEPRWDR